MVSKCEGCNLTIEKNDGKYRYIKPGVVLPIKLQDYNVVKQAYETGVCRALRL